MAIPANNDAANLECELRPFARDERGSPVPVQGAEQVPAAVGSEFAGNFMVARVVTALQNLDRVGMEPDIGGGSVRATSSFGLVHQLLPGLSNPSVQLRIDSLQGAQAGLPEAGSRDVSQSMDPVC